MLVVLLLAVLRLKVVCEVSYLCLGECSACGSCPSSPSEHTIHLCCCSEYCRSIISKPLCERIVRIPPRSDSMEGFECISHVC